MDDFFPIAQLKMKGFTLREKCLNTELFLVRILLYSVRIQENIDQTQLHILDSFHAVSVCHSYMTEVVEGVDFFCAFSRIYNLNHYLANQNVTFSVAVSLRKRKWFLLI